MRIIVFIFVVIRMFGPLWQPTFIRFLSIRVTFRTFNLIYGGKWSLFRWKCFVIYCLVFSCYWSVIACSVSVESEYRLDGAGIELTIIISRHAWSWTSVLKDCNIPGQSLCNENQGIYIYCLLFTKRIKGKIAPDSFLSGKWILVNKNQHLRSRIYLGSNTVQCEINIDFNHKADLAKRLILVHSDTDLN